MDEFLDFLREFANSKTGLLFLAAFSVALLGWGMWLVVWARVPFGAALAAYAFVVGCSATAALRSKQ